VALVRLATECYLCHLCVMPHSPDLGYLGCLGCLGYLGCNCSHGGTLYAMVCLCDVRLSRLCFLCKLDHYFRHNDCAFIIACAMLTRMKASPGPVTLVWRGMHIALSCL
jgi:hypothetical protein